MKIDNIEIIFPLLENTDSDQFYFLQIIKRRKDNPEMPTGEISIKSYILLSKEELIRRYDEIKQICLATNARAYLNLNRKSFSKTAFINLEKIVKLISLKEYRAIKDSYYSACSSHKSDENKKWMIDVDYDNIEAVNEIIECINLCKGSNTINVIDYIHTVSGFHIITHPFNVAQLESFKCPYTFDVHKNDPILLFYSDNK